MPLHYYLILITVTTVFNRGTVWIGLIFFIFAIEGLLFCNSTNILKRITFGNRTNTFNKWLLVTGLIFTNGGLLLVTRLIFVIEGTLRMYREQFSYTDLTVHIYIYIHFYILDSSHSIHTYHLSPLQLAFCLYISFITFTVSFCATTYTDLTVHTYNLYSLQLSFCSSIPLLMLLFAILMAIYPTLEQITATSS